MGMGQKDITQKKLEAYNDVFCDIVNGLLFEGRPVVKEDELEEQAPRSYYKVRDSYRQQERDVAMRWVKENVRIACIGLENQSAPDKSMPLRVLAYDGAEYYGQLKEKERKPRYPVVTLVLYFGMTPWGETPRTLYQALDIPEELKPFINDYKINLYEIAFLSREQVNRFKSDFRIVADYFVQKRETADYIPDPEQLRHVRETLELLSVMSGDPRFEEALDQKKGTVKNMCEVLDRVERRGERRGERIGAKSGITSVTILMQKLFEENRVDALKKASTDPEYMDALLKEYNLTVSYDSDEDENE